MESGKWKVVLKQSGAITSPFFTLSGDIELSFVTPNLPFINFNMGRSQMLHENGCSNVTSAGEGNEH